MKKRIILSIVFLLLFVGLIIYSVIFSYGEAEPLDLAENITMEIKEGTLTNKGATVIITDLSGNENIYNNEFRLDRKKNGRWHKMVKEDPVIVTPGATGKDENNKVVVSPTTGQNVTENILCKPTSEEMLKIYEENKVDISKLPDCKDMKVTGKYESIWNSIFVRPLAWLIVKLGEVVNSTGLAIILITIGIRILLFPVTQKTAMQSENMKKAQPELARLEKKYENKQDQESMMKKSQEMMAIYKKYNISPMAGCIFALLQIPLLFAFLEAINRIPAIFEENFLGIFQMGTTPLVALRNGDWYYLILLVLIVATTFISFKMNKSVANPELEKQTKGMMYFMIIFIGIMGFSLSSAIAVYWITSSVFTILQNVYTDIIKKRANN